MKGDFSLSALRVIGLTSVACFIAFLGYKYTFADPVGYCSSQKRFIPDSEYIKASVAILEWNAAGSSVVVSPDGKRTVVANKNMEGSMFNNWALEPANPNCCCVNRVMPAKESVYSVLQRMFGFQQDVWVTINPRKNPMLACSLGDSGIDIRYNVCGEIIPDDFAYYIGDAAVVISTTNYQQFIKNN